MANETERFFVLSKTFDLIKDIVRGATYVALAYWAFRAIDVLSGKQTDASFLVGYFTSQENDFGLPWLIAAIGVAYGFFERRLRLRKTEYLHNHVLELEKRIDVKRQSSNLLPTGETNPRDEL